MNSINPSCGYFEPVRQSRNKSFYFLFFLLAQSSIHAQTRLFVGPVVGGSISKAVIFDEPPNSSYRSKVTRGLDFGFMTSVRVRKNFCLNSQVLYAQRNKSISGINGDNESRIVLNETMKFIDIPINFTLEFKKVSGDENGTGGKIKTYNWFIGAGPTLSYWLSCKGNLTSGYLLDSRIPNLNYTTVFNPSNAQVPYALNNEVLSGANRLQLGINIVSGLAFSPVGMQKIVVGFQLNIAQSYLAKNDGIFPSSSDIDPMKVKLHSLRVSVAYLFDTKIEKSKKGKSTIKETNSKRRIKKRGVSHF